MCPNMAKQNSFRLKFSWADRTRMFKLIGVRQVGHFVGAQEGFCGKFGSTLFTNVIPDFVMYCFDVLFQGRLSP